jgi:organic hydroperoxide reductase OsmC/OhrA
MKTETLINIGIAACFAGFVACVALLAHIRNDKPKTEAKTIDTVKSDCNWCNVVKTYSLNVNCYHYGDAVEE